MAWIETEGEMHTLAVLSCPVGTVAEVILDVAAAAPTFGVFVGELLKDISWILPQDVGEHVQSSAMRHCKDDLLDAVAARFLNGEIEQGNEALASLEGKTLRADELLANEFLKYDGIGQLCENSQLFVARQHDVVLIPLHLLLKPLAHGRIIDVHELHADCPAVGIAKTIEDFSQLHRALLAERSAGKHAIQIRFRESVRCEVQFGCLEAAQPEGVHVGNAVSSYAVVPNESIDTLLQRGPGLAVVAGRR